MGLCEYSIVIVLRLRNRSMKKINNYQPSLSEEELEKEIKELSAPNCPWVNIGLSENPTELEQAKYKIAKSLLAYQQRNKLTYKEIAERIGIALKQTMEVLRGNIAKFSLDELVAYGERLHVPLKMKITVSMDYGKKRTESF